MPERLTAATCLARYEALAEAAEHLRLTWTEDRTEYAEGLNMASMLDRIADSWLRRATVLELQRLHS